MLQTKRYKLIIEPVQFLGFIPSGLVHPLHGPDGLIGHPLRVKCVHLVDLS